MREMLHREIPDVFIIVDVRWYVNAFG